jgi:hypothetical protein
VLASSMPDTLRVIEKVDLLLAELADLRSQGPHFRIRHRFHASPRECLPGEEILSVSLVHRSQEHWLPLSLSLRVLFDYMARYSRFPQSAAQIEAGVRTDPFFLQHVSNVMQCDRCIRRIPRSYVRVYIERMRKAIARAFSDAGCAFDVASVLLIETTAMNEVGYRLKAHFDWLHVGRELGAGFVRPSKPKACGSRTTSMNCRLGAWQPHFKTTLPKPKSEVA